MMQLEFHETGPMFTEENLLALEKRVGFEIPEDVVTFLRRDNGGSPLYYEFFVPGIDTTIDLLEVFGIGVPRGIEYWLDKFDGEMPGRSIPIGKESYGNQIVVRDDGGVYYWDGEGYYGDGSTSKVYKVADSFSAFVDSLQRVVL